MDPHFKVTFEFTDACPACGDSVKFGGQASLSVPETHVPGLEEDGNPMRILVFHRECAPAFVHAYHEWLRSE